MRRLRFVLILIIGVILGLETLLWHIDPLGRRRYQQDWYSLMRQSLPARDGYRFAPGTHDLEGFDVTIGLDGLRIVPDSAYADCRIAVLGDSVTFGFGVNDEHTFVNLLAQQFQDVQWVNAGLPAYSAANIRALREALAADGTIWLLFWNDDEPFRKFGRPPRVGSALGLYLGSLFHVTGNAIDGDFELTMTDLIRQRDMLVFAFEDNRLSDALEQSHLDVILLPVYTEPISPADPHPNIEGHRQIAEAMQSYLPAFIERVCHA